MVTTLNITLDDAVADRAREVKEENGLTWPEFIEEAAEALEGTNADADNWSSEISRETMPESNPEPLGVEDIELELPGSGEKLRAREDAIYAMRDRLRELGRANKDDLLEVVDADDVEYASKDSFWSNCVKGKETLRVLRGVKPPAEGNRTWKWDE